MASKPMGSARPQHARPSALELNWNDRRRLVILFVFILLAVALTIALTYQGLNRILQNEERINHAYRVMATLDATLAALVDAETTQRGFLITGRETYLEPYKAAAERVADHAGQLVSLATESASLQAQAVLIEHVAEAKLEELERTLHAWREGAPDSARAIVLSNEGKRLMDEVRVLVAAIKTQEQALLAQRHDESVRLGRQASVTLLGAGASLVALLVLFYGQLRRADRLRVELLNAEHQSRQEAENAAAAERRGRTELQRLNALKDQFLATVSHELRTPLNAMLGWASMLRAGVSGDTFNRAIASIERNARSQAQLVEDLLDVSRIIAGKMKLAAVAVDVNAVVRQAVDVVRPAADAKEITVDAVVDDSACWVKGDSERLQQVIWNLLSNAVKFTPKRGHVIVSCTIDASRVIVSVRDTGRGIPPEFVEHVFEPFRQMDQSSTRTHAGLGLGLAIARSLVELHGGTIEAVSEGLDRGATFTVTLPVLGVLHEGVAIAGVGPEELPRAAPSLNDLKVVVVDDQADTLELVSTVLVGLGAHVRACDSAREALTTVRTWRPDVLIADIAMPGEDGYSLIRKVRALDETEGGETQAIALTAHAHIDDRLRALAAGFQMHVPKPVEPTELAAIVAGLAGRDVT